MPVHEISVGIAASPQAVWEVLAERFGALHTWARGMPPCRLEGEGPIGVGTTRIVDVPRMGALRETIVVFEPTHHLAYTVEGLPGMLRNVRSDWYVREDDAGCRVTLVSSSETGWGPLGALLVRALDGVTRSQLEGLTKSLKRACERPAADA